MAICGQGQVAWSDTDASGRFHYTAAMRWVENAEHDFYRSVDPGFPIGAMPRRVVTATYHRPLAAGDVFRAELEPQRIGSTSISYRWRVLRGEDLCVEGEHTVVHVGADGRPAPLPVELRRALEAAAS